MKTLRNESIRDPPPPKNVRCNWGQREDLVEQNRVDDVEERTKHEMDYVRDSQKV